MNNYDNIFQDKITGKVSGKKFEKMQCEIPMEYQISHNYNRRIKNLAQHRLPHFTIWDKGDH